MWKATFSSESWTCNTSGITLDIRTFLMATASLLKSWYCGQKESAFLSLLLWHSMPYQIFHLDLWNDWENIQSDMEMDLRAQDTNPRSWLDCECVTSILTRQHALRAFCYDDKVAVFWAWHFLQGPESCQSFTIHVLHASQRVYPCFVFPRDLVQGWLKQNCCK